METLGVWLRQTREARDETLEDIQIATRIKVRFLEMLEGGEFGAFPGGEVQVRGFLRIYARHLGLSPEEVLSRYEKETLRVEPAPAGAPAELQPAPPVRSVAGPMASHPPSVPAPSALPEWLSLETMIIASIVLIVVLVIFIAVILVIGQNKGMEEAPAPTPSVTLARALPLPTATAAPPAVTPTFPVNPDGSVMLTLEATEHVWVRVTVDGITAFEGILSPGQAQSWSGREEVAVDTGNGAGLLVTVNGQSQGVVGGRGQVCSRSWGPTGEVTVP